MSDEISFYCQACDHQIGVEQLATLNQGECPACHSMEGFSTLPKSANDGFEQVTMLNDSEMLKKMDR